MLERFPTRHGSQSPADSSRSRREWAAGVALTALMVALAVWLGAPDLLTGGSRASGASGSPVPESIIAPSVRPVQVMSVADPVSAPGTTAPAASVESAEVVITPAPGAEPAAVVEPEPVPATEPEFVGTADIVMWGDSLAAEATATFHEVLSGRDDVNVSEAVWPGLAICDFLGSIAEISAAGAVDVAVIEFSGNSMTECMIDPATGSQYVGQALLDRYEADITEAIGLLGDAGATVVLAGAPPVRPGSEHEYRTQVVELYRDVAPRYDHVQFSDTGAVLADAGEYTDMLPCLPDESEAQGCVDGQIQVRNADGLHIGLGDPNVWASGRYRYGISLAEAALAAIGR